jgi:hypothetical protein
VVELAGQPRVETSEVSVSSAAWSIDITAGTEIINKAI